MRAGFCFLSPRTSPEELHCKIPYATSFNDIINVKRQGDGSKKRQGDGFIVFSELRTARPPGQSMRKKECPYSGAK
jgi:hypothetical protein